ncbi:MAG: glutaminyl-tRNA synthase (glutamine-hydrolyzing) subunit B [Candidatus Yonathbacteria bacterium RIFOXYC1_FULL_52_10]|uniref:Aspartyl/glutamyl-tRNA(Asn/Gln) amidotransferase subunit B n=1 Tax=Candidatus Yonathbacteria bacterium RIFOXYD1_FULL_52_36 TaxID=1802730 RepID=A0A1G2SLF6_9BACT|nr:MAG: glutaminyl-tRNA synthase (glutamine-hydrolyzing) subunit B [Candidatus Yonathbacteria bacterium RIFOXYC1_FULL_52_10]OHA85885.1 MAG: glutaminyl-tRNA synthase (glutamine-hydrolyzing) subunit B [Candidatus Yonathbacteria bacterium RIFOXYD1_FULL_52_36]
MTTPSRYKPTIGLEVHAELFTHTKMFCACKNNPDEKRPNVNICPVCMAHPGTLPVINREAVKHVLKVGTAVGGTLADFTEFDRKNYFYPDIPKGYQISQYQYPLVSGGALAGVLLTRIHLEEDTARSSHERGEGTLVDFNRAGVPLMELVTEPVVRNAEEAGMFARELQLLLRTLGVSEANMEKGEMRVEANISISSTEQFGTKVEVKNLNSFRSVERAIAYEIERQTKLLDRGEAVMQETRGWDETKGTTFSQRKKESAHDYRYFPDPDLPKLLLSEIPELAREVLQNEMPELPWEKRTRLVDVYGVKEETARMLTERGELSSFFEHTAQMIHDKQGYTLAENYVTSDLVGLAQGGDILGKITPDNFAALIKMILESKISSRGAKEILSMLYKDGGEPEKIAQEKNLIQQSDEGTLTILAKKVVEENPDVVAEYRSGKESVLQFLVGQGMKLSRGGANPELLKNAIIQAIAE